jgi:hypothetical protein
MTLLRLTSLTEQSLLNKLITYVYIVTKTTVCALCHYKTATEIMQFVVFAYCKLNTVLHELYSLFLCVHVQGNNSQHTNHSLFIQSSQIE